MDGNLYEVIGKLVVIVLVTLPISAAGAVVMLWEQFHRSEDHQ